MLLPDPKRILIRLPNWLGDMVMSRFLVAAVREHFPNAHLGFIVKKGLDHCPGVMPEGSTVYLFSKSTHKGLAGVYRFGRMLSRDKWDLFICLPESFSSAVMAWASRASVSIGYGKEGRSFLLSKTFAKPHGLHRADVYRYLLYAYLGKQLPAAQPILFGTAPAERTGLVVNINSEAVSRRWPIEKAVSILTDVYRALPMPVTLVGSPADREQVDALEKLLPADIPVTNLAGKTSLPELVEVIRSAKWMLSSDSGPAHLAGLTNTPLVVTFGAGDESETGPLFFQPNQVLRLGQLPCEPCRSNTCKLAALPPCLLQLNNNSIVAAAIAVQPKS